GYPAARTRLSPLADATARTWARGRRLASRHWVALRREKREATRRGGTPIRQGCACSFVPGSHTEHAGQHSSQTSHIGSGWVSIWRKGGGGNRQCPLYPKSGHLTM